MTTKRFCNPRPCREKNWKQVAAAVRAASADIVVFQETIGLLPELARIVGLPYYSIRTHVASRFPLLDPPEGETVPLILVEVSPGSVVAICSVHALSSPYGPYELKSASDLDAVLKLESDFRAPPTLNKAHLAIDWTRSNFGASAIPLLLVGDLNSPSPLDWNAAAVAARQLPCIVNWPLVAGLQKLGFIDGYRTVYGNPVYVPGFTWTPGGPEGAEPPDKEVMDRIDMIHQLSGPPPDDAWTIGPRGGIVVDPWPSDHQAVAVRWSTLQGVPLKAPLVSIRHRIVRPLVPVQVYAFWPQEQDGVCEIRALELGADTPPSVVQVAQSGLWTNLNITGNEGAYSVELWCKTQRLSSAPVWIIPESQAPVISLVENDSAEVKSGEPFKVHVYGAPGAMLDYVAVYSCSDGPSSCRSEADWAVYVNTGAIVQGDVLIAPPFFMEGNSPVWPLPPGLYCLQFLRDDDETFPMGNSILFKVIPAHSIYWLLALLSGICLLLIAALVFVWWCCRRRRRANHSYDRY